MKAKTRVIGYQWIAEFDEPRLERLLEKALQEGVVSQYDTGRGHYVWVNGWPGSRLRVLRDAISRLIGVEPTPRNGGDVTMCPHIEVRHGAVDVTPPSTRATCFGCGILMVRSVDNTRWVPAPIEEP